MRWSRRSADSGGVPHDVQQATLEQADDVVQHLTVATYALSVGDLSSASSAVDAALAASRHVVTDLCDASQDSHGHRAGHLVRREPATTVDDVGVSMRQHRGC
jgi:hypothetical protein